MRIDLTPLYRSPTSTLVTANHHRLHAGWRFELVTENTLFQALRDRSPLNQKYDDWTLFVFNWCLTSSQCFADVVLPDTTVRRSGMGVLGTTFMVSGWVEHQPRWAYVTIIEPGQWRSYRWMLLNSYIRLSSPNLRLISNQTKALIDLDTSLSCS
jgi:hypothetical protein